MKIRFLLDENLDPDIKAGLLRRDPTIDILCIGDAEAPPKATPDPAILAYVERTTRLLVTNNRVSMPAHLAAHFAAGRRHWGILTTGDQFGLGQVIEDLYLLWEASEAEEWRDLVAWLPL